MKTITRLCVLAGIASLAQLVPLVGNAQPTTGGERAGIIVGAFITDRQSTTRLDSDDGSGTQIDLEDDLGLESSTNVARLGGYVWLGKRHRLDGAYFNLNRDSTFPIKETIDFGDQTFVIDTSIETESKLSIIKADYTYAVLAKDRGWLGLTGRLYIADTSLTLSQTTLGQVESEDVMAPLPVFGLRGDYAFNDHITLRGAAQWFAYENQDVDGRLTDFYVGADYGFGERMAVGLAYNRVSMNLGAIEDTGFDSRLDWGYDGFMLYFKVDLGSRNQ
ncbi:MAG TPA: hypothetical protein VNA66_01940 [Gammaproteobacteria bacterium]|nr:hypothetical protein [Gammaproteobacteria bacterium]